MNYKVITYTCDCQYVFITDPEKQILKDHKFCPVHGKLKKYVMLWCQDCGLKMVETGMHAWQIKKRCLKCKKIDQKKRTKLNWQKKAKEYNIKRRTKSAKKIDHFAMLKRGALRRLYRSMDRALPVVETPIIDRYIRGNNV